MRDDSFNAIDGVSPVDAPIAVLPQAPSADADMKIVPPDHPAVAAQTDDRTVTHAVCHAEVTLPGASFDMAASENGVLYCPTCRDYFPVDQFDRRAR